MQNLLKYILLLALPISLCANVAIAKTPDGEPPSVETICDVFSGAAFGLCNAYCEAMDCGDPNQAASARACDRVNNNFEKHTGFRLPEEPSFNDDTGEWDNICLRQCEPEPEICGNGLDDDCDGSIDEEDDDCTTV